MSFSKSLLRRDHNLLTAQGVAPITGPVTKGKGGSNTAGKGHGKTTVGPIPTYNQGSTHSSANGSSLTLGIKYPDIALAANDLILMYYFYEDLNLGSSGVTDIAVPSGFTAMTGLEHRGPVSARWFWKRAAGGEIQPTTVGVTRTGGSTAGGANRGHFGGMMIVRGAITTGTPVEAVSVNRDVTATQLGVQITTLGANRLACSQGVQAYTQTPGATNWTSRNGYNIDGATPSNYGDHTMTFDTLDQASAGQVPSVPTRTIPGATHWITCTFAVIPT